jgi:hypothetical protein
MPEECPMRSSAVLTSLVALLLLFVTALMGEAAAKVATIQVKGMTCSS